MTVSNYKKGRRFEYQVRKELEEMGLFCVRQAKSAFPDIIAVDVNCVWVVECKYNGYLSKSEKEALWELYARYGVIPIFASKKKGQARPNYRLAPLPECLQDETKKGEAGE